MVKNEITSRHVAYFMEQWWFAAIRRRYLLICLKQDSAIGTETGGKFPKTLLISVLSAHDLALVSGGIQAQWYIMLSHQRLSELPRSLPFSRGCVCHCLWRAMKPCRTVKHAVNEPQNYQILMSRPMAKPTGRTLRWTRCAMTFHHHMGTAVETEAELTHDGSYSEAVGLLLDTGHLLAGGDNASVIEKYGKRINALYQRYS